jgi:hypothetical protein
MNEKEQTSIRIFKMQKPWIKKCCKFFNFGTAELIQEWERQVKMKKQQEFYNSLPMPNSYRKRLCEISIRKTGTPFR